MEENIFWHHGLSYDTKSTLQQPGFLKTAENILFEIEGKQTLRPSFEKVNVTAVSHPIHSVGVLLGNLVVGHGTVLTWVSAAGVSVELGTHFDNYPWSWKQYKDFLHGVNGTGEVLFDVGGNLFPGKIANPITSPTGTAGAAGNPDGAYSLYVSYLIIWPNLMTYETGLSPVVADVTVTSTKIEWANIPICPYAAYYGTSPTIKRVLYRGPGTGSALAGIYYVDTIADNSTTTYTDDFSDADLAGAGLCLVADYGPMPDTYFHEYNYGRRFCIDKNYIFRQYYTEAANGLTATDNETIMPLATRQDNYDDIRVSGFGSGVTPQALVAWGVYLHTALKHTWVRKQGNDPATWSFKKTYANHGITAPLSVDVCSNPASIWGFALSEDGDTGIAIYNGQTSEIANTIKLKDLLKTDLSVDYASTCQGKFVGNYYHFLYPSILSTGLPDTHLALDFSRYPDVRIGEWTGLYSTCFAVDKQSGDFYVGGSDGFVRKRVVSGESINFDVSTHESIGGKPEYANHEKTLKELRYNINTGGENVSLEFWIDGLLKMWPDGETVKTITGTDDSVQVLHNLPGDFKGYKYLVRVYGTSMTTVEINSPWTMVFDLTV